MAQFALFVSPHSLVTAVLIWNYTKTGTGDLNTSDHREGCFVEAGWACGYHCWQETIQSKCRIGLQTQYCMQHSAGSCRDTQIENLQIRLTTPSSSARRVLRTWTKDCQQVASIPVKTSRVGVWRSLRRFLAQPRHHPSLQAQVWV